MLSAAVLFPLPDSPTSAVAVPELHDEIDAAHGLNGATAGVVVGVQVFDFEHPLPPGRRVAAHAEPVTHQVGGEHGEAEGDAGHRRHPPPVREVLAPVVEHAAP